MFNSVGHPHPLSYGALLLALLFGPAAQAAIPISEDACRRLSEGAKITNTKALIIGYEGLFSSSPINANLLSSYREKLATGKPARRPLYIFGGSFLTRGPLTKIVEQYKNRVQVLMFGRHQTSASSVPGKCATIWMNDKGPGTEGRKVIIVGHSFGGAAAHKLAKSLQVKVDAVVTADPRDPVCLGECFPGTKPSNVTFWSNHYQLTPLRGHKVGGAQNHYHSGYSHGTIQNAPAFYQAIARRIDGVSGPLTVAAPTHTNEGNPGKGGTFNPSSISGVPGAAQTAQANPIPDGKGAAQDAAAPVQPKNSFLAAAARASPARSRETEKAWMDRASGYETTAGSGIAKGVQGDGVVRYYKPGGGPSEKSGRGLSMTGASTPGKLAAQSQPTAGGDSGLSDSTGRAGSSSTAMLNKMWPLSKGDTGSANSGPGFSFGGGGGSSSPPSGTGNLDPNLGPDAASLASASGVFASAEIAAAETADAAQAAKGELVTSSTSLFRRVHLKHVHWFQRRDRF